MTVKFGIDLVSVTGSGLSRLATARVTNNGSTNANNTWAKVEVFTQGVKILLGKMEFIRVDLGIIEPGQAVEQDVLLEFNFFDGLKIMQSGAQVLLTVCADECDETFNFDYSP